MAELSPVRRGETAAASFNGTTPLQRTSTSIGCYSPSNGASGGSSTVVGNDVSRSVAGSTSSSTFGIQWPTNKSQSFVVQHQTEEEAVDRTVGSRDINMAASTAIKNAVRNHSLMLGCSSSLVSPVLCFSDERQHPTTKSEYDEDTKITSTPGEPDVQEEHHHGCSLPSEDSGCASPSEELLPPPLEPHRDCSPVKRVRVPEVDSPTTDRKRSRSRSPPTSSSKTRDVNDDFEGMSIDDDSEAQIDLHDGGPFSTAQASGQQQIRVSTAPVRSSYQSLVQTTHNTIISQRRTPNVDDSCEPQSSSATFEQFQTESSPFDRRGSGSRSSPSPTATRRGDGAAVGAATRLAESDPVVSTLRSPTQQRSSPDADWRSPTEVDLISGQAGNSPTVEIWRQANGTLPVKDNGSASEGDESDSCVEEDLNDEERAIESRRRFVAAITAAAAGASDVPMCLPQLSGGNSIPSMIYSSSSSSLALASMSFVGSGQPTSGQPMFRNVDDMGFATVNETSSVSGGNGNVLPVSGHLVQHHQQSQPATSRNSCKTLKCPKCNWHYKYQETLEIHMREKHPETDAACAYCAGGGAHPRLARGESYTCGYKPYRCDVCNYSTTTKGNLSIHLQSDKHTNNVQELQQNAAIGTGNASTIVSVGQSVPSLGLAPPSDVKLSGGTMSGGTPPSTPSSVGCCPPVMIGGGGNSTVGQRKQHQHQHQQPTMCGGSANNSPSGGKLPKPSWRCDFCGYETTEARNLRIHMTSEKHAHNMLALQQSAAAVSVAHQMALYGPDAACASAAAAAVAAASLMGLGGGASSGGSGMPSTPPCGPSHTTTGTSPFDQFLAGFLPSSSTSNAQSSVGLSGPLSCLAGSASSADSPMDLTKNPDVMSASAIANMFERRSTMLSGTSFDADDSPCLFRCTICDVFSTDSLDALQAHIQLDRSSKPQPNGSDQPPGVAVVSGGSYLCTLCQYRTALKANFQLHCKTDKHLQRLQLVNHVQEGCLDGSTAGWDRPLPSSAVEVRCAACDYRTNSVYRLQMHAASPPHVARATLFRFLCAAEAASMLAAATVAARNQVRPSVSARPNRYRCVACGVSARNRLGLIEHSQSAQHVQNEALHLQSVPGADSADYFRLLGSVFVVETVSASDNTSDSDSETGATADGTHQHRVGQSVASCLDSGSRKVDDEEEDDINTGSKSSHSDLRSTFNSPTSTAQRVGSHGSEPRGGVTGVGDLEQRLAARHGATGGGIVDTDPQPDAAGSGGNRIHAGSGSTTVSCILCMECIGTRDELQRHLLTVHKVKPETLQSILRLADSVSASKSDLPGDLKYEVSAEGDSTSQSPLPRPTGSTSELPFGVSATDEGSKVNAGGGLRVGVGRNESQKLTINEDDKDGTSPADDNESRSSVESDRLCHTCSQSFQTIDALYAHQTELGHFELTQTPTGPGYLCWHRDCQQYFRTAAGVQAHHREAHALIGDHKFRCSTCAMSFQTAAHLQAHSHCHEIRSGRSATDCLVCGQQFGTVDAVQRHVDAAHSGPGGELERYRSSLAAASSLALLGGASAALDGFSAAEPTTNPRTMSSASSEHSDHNSDASEPMTIVLGGTKDDQPSKDSPVGGAKYDHSRVNHTTTKFPNTIGEGDDGKLDENSNSNMAETMETDVLPVIAPSAPVREPMHCQTLSYSSSISTEGDYSILKYKCHRCKVAFAKMNQLSAHNRTPAHRQGSKSSVPVPAAVTSSLPTSVAASVGGVTSTQALDKYRDPNRPFKCEVCLESFTQKNILLVHYNSVSHLHRLKQQQQQQQQMELLRQHGGSGERMDQETDGEAGASSKQYQQQWSNESQNTEQRTMNESVSCLSSTRVEPILSKPEPETSSASPAKDRDAASSEILANSNSKASPLKHGQTADNKTCLPENLNCTSLSSPTKALIAACPPSSNSSSSKNADLSPVVSGHAASATSTHRLGHASVRTDVETGRPSMSSTNAIQPSTPSSNPPMTPLFNQNNMLLQQQQMQMFLADMFQQQFFGHPSIGSFFQMPGMVGQPGMIGPGPPVPLMAASPQMPPNGGGGGTAKSSVSEKPHARVNDTNHATQQHQQHQHQLQQHHGPSNSTSYQTQPATTTSAHVCQKCGAIFGAADQLQQHQQMHCNGGSASRYAPAGPASVVAVSRTDLATASASLAATGAYKSRMQQVLLENFGFECAMQFNEFRQKSVKPPSVNVAPAEDTDTSASGTDGRTPMETGEVDGVTTEAGVSDVPTSGDGNKSLPELKRSTCSKCSKEFSSIWVLKAHEEEVHQTVLSVETVAEFARLFRELNEKQHPVATTVEARPQAEQSVTPRISRKNEPPSLPPNLLMQPSSAGITLPSPDSAARTPRVTSGQFAADLVAMQHAAAQLMQLPLLMSMMGGMGQQQQHQLSNGIPPGMMQMMMPLGTDLFGLPPGFAAAMMDPTMMMLAQQQQQQQQQHQQRPSATGQTGSSLGMGGAMQSVDHSQQPPQQQPQQQAKSARTRINDDQLAVLRAHFDINNSPSEDQIRAMSERTGLPPKVIKHWFRNTLFKERQRNKDSPYNFSVPPATTLNIEDYERTAPSVKRVSMPPQTSAEDLKVETSTTPAPMKLASVVDASVDKTSTPAQPVNQPEHNEDRAASRPAVRAPSSVPSLGPGQLFPELSAAAITSMVQMSPGFSAMPTLVGPTVTPTRLPVVGSMSGIPGMVGGNGSDPSGGSHSSTERRANRTRFTNHQIRVLHEFFEKNAYPKDDELEALSRMLDLSPRVIVVWFQNARQKVRKNNENQPTMSISSTSASDLGTDLSQHHHNQHPAPIAPGSVNFSGVALTTQPHVSAMPPTALPNGDDTTEHRCKRCPASFRQFYELIKHQQAVCYKDEAGAGAYAADSDSSQDEHDGSDNDASQSSMGSESHSAGDGTALASGAGGGSGEGSMTSGIEYRCDRCDATFNNLQSWNEHQSVHTSGSGGPTLSLVCQESSMSANVSAAESASSKPIGGDVSASLDELSGQGRWASDDGGSDDLRSGNGTSGGGGDKRMRTTILPEQLDFLYHKYQADCNPSRKQLDAIASHVGLKKRVVQVWFQNTRARERKGQYRVHQQLIHKRCPFCKALFRARTALEAHLATKHPDEMAHTDINVDNIPDEPADLAPPISASMSSPPVTSSVALVSPKPALPNGPFVGASGTTAMTNPFLVAAASASSSASMNRTPGAGDLLQANMQRLYEDSLRHYINELSHAGHPVKTEQPGGRFTPAVGDFKTEQMAAFTPSSAPSATAAVAGKGKTDDAPLDLSTSSTTTRGGHGGGTTDHVTIRGGVVREDQTPFSNQRRASSQEDTRSESRSENNDDYSVDYSNQGDGGGSGSNPASPGGGTGHHQSKQHQMSGGGGTPGGSGYIPGKRYRTQMSSIQIRVMKAIFTEYRTPTMSECESLGREISLPRRVVQVWFQNARAKEKKIGLPGSGDVQSGSSPTGSSSSSSVVLMNPTSESCDLCGVRYTSQHTIQDHLFTRAHVDRVKAMVCNQRDSLGSCGESGSNRHAEESASRNRKFSSSRLDVDAPHHQPSGQTQRPVVPNGGLPMTSPGPTSASHSMSDKRSAAGSAKAKQEPSDANKTLHGGIADMAAIFGGAGASGPLSANVVNSATMAQLFGGPYAAAGFPVTGPGDVVGMMPYFYPGLAGFYPGATMGMPFMQPPMMPGPESMFMFDPANFGTPLAMLQIPGRAIQRIQEKLTNDPDCTLTYYSQDCRHFSELRKVVSADDAAVARRASVDVGYICRRCQIVYPGRSTCAAHQESACYRDAASGSAGAGGSVIPAGAIVKLEQMQYECASCRGNPRFSTAAEYKSHCSHESHRTSTTAWLRMRSNSSTSSSQNRPSSSSTALPSPSDVPRAGASTPLPSSRNAPGK